MPATIMDLDALAGVTCEISYEGDPYIYNVNGPGYQTTLRIKTDGSGLGYNSEDQIQLESLADSVKHAARLSPTYPSILPEVSFKAQLLANVTALDPGTATIANIIDAILDADIGSTAP